MAISEAETHGSQSVLERSAEILEILGWADGMKLSAIARSSDIPRTSLHRLLQQMIDIGWVERLGDQYFLGTGLRVLGQRALEQPRVRRAAVPWMYQVRDATQFNVHLTVLVSYEAVNLETVWGSRAPAQFGVARQPAHATASGKVLLAGLLAEDPELDELPEMTPLTDYTNTSKSRLLQELRKVCEEGVAVAREECQLNWVSVAVPVGAIDEATYALAISGPSHVVRTHEVVRPLRTAAAGAWVDATSALPRRKRFTGAPYASLG